jgi:hypothetical protein
MPESVSVGEKRMSIHTGLFRTAARVNLYLFLCSAVLLLFFVLGNLQEFLESTLFLLLDLLEWALIAFIAAHLVYAVTGFLSRAGRHKSVRLIVLTLLGFLYGAGLLMTVNLFAAWLFYGG